VGNDKSLNGAIRSLRSEMAWVLDFWWKKVYENLVEVWFRVDSGENVIAMNERDLRVSE
jgi:hypothetical protein